MTIEDFYLRIKRDHANTWSLMNEINKNKLTSHPVSINKNMLFMKHDKEIPDEVIEPPIPTTDDLLFNIPIKSL